MDQALATPPTTQLTSQLTSQLTKDRGIDSGWEARLALRLARRGEDTRLMRADRHGPLTVQRPFYPEGGALAHVYLLHPPGGLVSGDRLEISATLEPGSAALITTPGAGRAYGARQRNPEQHQHITLAVAEGACLEWFPMENIVYRGAQLHARTEIQLGAGARFAGWEINCLGLPASNAPFDCGAVQQRLQLRCGERLVFVDQLRLAAPSPLQSHAAGLNGCSVSGLLLAGPFAASADADHLIEQMRGGLPADAPVALTRIEDFLVARYLGDSAFDARQLFCQLWAQLRPALMNRPACAPRIWAT